MKALVYTGVMMSEIQDVVGPEPEAGQVLIDLCYCGICGSDMHAWHGHDDRRIPPLILGHEATGIARGGLYEGQYVAINPLMTCKSCEVCLSGQMHLCPSRELIGMRVPGAFAGQVAVDEANLFPLPPTLSLEDAALAEPLACAIHAVRLFEKTQTPETLHITILGGGAIGLLAALFCEYLGYGRVDIAETNDMRREMLRDLHIGAAYNPQTETKPDHCVDRVLDAVGSGMTRAEAVRLVKAGGQIVHIGLQDSSDGLDIRRITLQELTFKGSYCYQTEDFATAIDLLDNHSISTQGWIQIRDLAAGPQAFMDIHNGCAPPKIILQAQ